MRFTIGTSGYSYKDWEGVFYPPGLPSGQRLEYYANYFNVVEINSTYYSIPNPAVFYHLQRKTSQNFEFIIKTHRETTHGRKENIRAMKDLITTLAPLIEADKFRGFLAQFPYSFKNNPANREYLLRTRELAGDFPLFVEFRNWTWNRPEITPFLKENHIGYVNVDEPPLRGLIPPQAIATTDIAYVRFHGRNQKEWWNGTNETRYDYLYSDAELEEWTNRLSILIKRSLKTYIFFNNHPKGKAIQNALSLRKLLEKQPEIFLD
jgi:uncharacterized protein YecE (DUF72 family)